MKNNINTTVIIIIALFCFIIIRIIPEKHYPEGQKINYIINQIDANYVDSININSLIESSIEQTLNNLDPHSIYMTKKDIANIYGKTIYSQNIGKKTYIYI